MATIKDLQEWVERDLIRWGGPDCIETMGLTEAEKPQSEDDPLGEPMWRFRIYTATNCYSIVAKERSEDTGYLGCIASCRKPRAGEDWTRGNDLPDGPFSEQTWRRILAAIVAYELVRVHKPREPQPSIPEQPVAEATAS